MARMYGNGKGISRRCLPYVRTQPRWSQTTSSEVEEQIKRMCAKGMTASQIGANLRDTVAIPSVKAVTGSGILRIMKKLGLLPKTPEDLYFLIKKASSMRRHLEKNAKDSDCKYRLICLENKIYRLARYYRSCGKIPITWKYSGANAATLIA
eukprot:GHVH01012310.1.p1 GENE.GHVH01012310.1~~GHVH01012310.1.p1  ORF type:complete len:152 (-),score=17.91 GHVH01012310.1:40-495(-)